MNQLGPDQLLAEASILVEKGETIAALQRLQDAVRLAPDQARYWSHFGRALKRAERFDEACACLVRAAALDPADIDCRSQLGHLASDLSRVDEAIRWHGEALQRQPDSLMLQLNHLFVLPLVASSLQEIEHCRQRLIEGLPALLIDPSLRLYQGQEFGAHTFLLAYQGRNDRAVLQAYGDLLSRFFGDSARPGQDWLTAANSSAPRHRIGFLSAYFYNHSNARAFEGLIGGLDRDRFELVLLPLEGTPTDAFCRELQARCDRVVTVPQPLDAASKCLRGLGLDLLFFTDVGMHPLVSTLVSRRHAPVQVAGWGIPHTTGFACIDHYISGDLVEPSGAQDHYGEKLVQLPGLPCRYLSRSLALPPANLPKVRQYFLLPDDVRIFGCLQDFRKLHPDFDLVLEAIARRVPDALFVFVEPGIPCLGQIFLDRIANSAPTLAQRLVLLARMSRAEYMGLAGCLDLLLDPLHYGSGITVFETMATGTPTITLEGNFLRSRFLAGAYRQMGLVDAPIATSSEDYVELAVAMMGNDARRLALRERICQAALLHLYDRIEMVRGFEDFAIEAIAQAKSRQS